MMQTVAVIATVFFAASTANFGPAEAFDLGIGKACETTDDCVGHKALHCENTAHGKKCLLNDDMVEHPVGACQGGNDGMFRRLGADVESEEIQLSGPTFEQLANRRRAEWKSGDYCTWFYGCWKCPSTVGIGCMGFCYRCN